MRQLATVVPVVIRRACTAGGDAITAAGADGVTAAADDVAAVIIRKLLRVDPESERRRLAHLSTFGSPRRGPSMAGHDLRLGLQKLSIFNARRKLRAAIQSILLTNRVALALGLPGVKSAS